MRVLVADKFEESGLEGLRGLGVEVAYDPALKEGALAEAIRDSCAEVLVVRSTRVERAMIEAGRLALVIRAGAGYNTIDVEAACERGVLVANCPGKNANAVAELALGLILACDRRIPDNVAELRAGRWNKKEFSKARGLHGRTLGIVGMGQIGQLMIPIGKALGMKVVAYSRWMTNDVAAALGIGAATSLEALAAESDVVTVHVSLTPSTRQMLGPAFFKALRHESIFVNTSRAEVVNQDALLEAVGSGRLFAGLDVFEGEPTSTEGGYDGALKENPRVYCTHHIGASTDQAQEAVAAEVVRIVREYRDTGIAPNVVNVERSAESSHVVVVRHRDEVGVLAHVLEHLSGAGVNVQEMENIVLGGSQAAIAQMAIDAEPSADVVQAIRSHRAIFDVCVLPLPH